jgi:hypothetical protein
MQEPEPTQRKVDLIEIIGGALAAVSAAFVASTLGVTGTLLGAAVMSVVAAIGGALYTRSLEHAHARVRRRRTPRPGNPEPADRAPPTPRSLPWGRVAAMAGLVFVLAIGAMTTIERTAGYPFSDLMSRFLATRSATASPEAPATPPSEQGETTLSKVFRRPRNAGQDTTPEPPERDQAPASPAPTPTEAEPTDERDRERTPTATPEPERDASPEPERDVTPEPEATPAPNGKPSPALPAPLVPTDSPP